MKKAYIALLVEALLTNDHLDNFISGLRAYMQRRGHGQLWSQVVRAAFREYVVKERRMRPTLSVASTDQIDEEQVKRVHMRLTGSPDTPVTTIIDPTVIGGFTLRVKGKMYDASYKRALLALYTTLTK